MRLGWAKLLKRDSWIGMEHCPNRGGELKIIAAILEQPVIEKILTHLGLQARAPPRAPARGLAVTSMKRLAAVPELPTVNEAPGLKDRELIAYFAVYAPAGRAPDSGCIARRRRRCAVGGRTGLVRDGRQWWRCPAGLHQGQQVGRAGKGTRRLKRPAPGAAAGVHGLDRAAEDTTTSPPVDTHDVAVHGALRVRPAAVPRAHAAPGCCRW